LNVGQGDSDRNVIWITVAENSDARLRILQRDVEGGGIASRCLHDVEHELGSSTVINAISRIPERALALGCVWLLGVHYVGERVVEEELRGELIGRCR
jgi:hypothetical protein